MIHALHGNAGLPEDLIPLLNTVGMEYRAWLLWQWLREHPESASFEGFASALNAADASSGKRILLGYSLGGRLALSALTQPAITLLGWDAAILLSVHPGLADEKERADRLQTDQAWAKRFSSEPWPEVMYAWNAQPVLAGESGSRDTQRSVEPWRREVAMAFDVWSLGRQTDFRPLLAAVTCPVLWITGERDAKFTLLAKEASKRMPRAQHVVIPGAGHRVHLDQPEAVATVVRDFLH